MKEIIDQHIHGSPCSVISFHAAQIEGRQRGQQIVILTQFVKKSV
jgi:hypothetical protein